MELEQLKQPNKYIEYIKNNKYNLYFVIAIVILLFMIIVMIVVTINHKNTSPINKNSSPNQSSPTLSNETPSSTAVPITTPNPTEAAVIENQIQPQITPAASYTYSNIKKFGDNWATMIVSSPSVEDGGLIVQKIDGSWKIVEGPGTFFPPALLQSIDAPQELIDSFNPSEAPSSEISPSGTQNSNDIQ